jgi:hypothetical protein
MKVTVNARTIGTQNNADVMQLGSATTAAPSSSAAARAGAALAVFVSHSSRDRVLAEAMSELLSRALLLGAAAIRCTSVDGHRLAAGAGVSEALRADIREAAAFVALVTPRSLSSPYVLFELGARWGQGTPFLPVMGAGLDASALRPPLSEMSFLRLDRAAEVEQLVAEVGSLVGRAVEPPATYPDAMKRLVEAAAALAPP